MELLDYFESLKPDSEKVRNKVSMSYHNDTATALYVVALELKKFREAAEELTKEVKSLNFTIARK